MTSFNLEKLNRFYARISAEEGIAVSDLQSELASLFTLSRSITDLDSFRLSRGPWKKLADEVSPVSRFFQGQNIQVGRLRFPLDDHPPDAWYSFNGDKVGIEVTVAQGRERFHLAQEMVREGIGRGFLGLPDDAPRAEFQRLLARRRTMYSPNQALVAVRQGILRCLARKNDSKYAGWTLVIQAHLIPLPRERWKSIIGVLKAAASTLPFKNIHVISDASERPWGFQLK